jgi:hypothetical protein
MFVSWYFWPMCILSKMIKECVKEERNVGDWDFLSDLRPP